MEEGNLGVVAEWKFSLLSLSPFPSSSLPPSHWLLKEEVVQRTFENNDGGGATMGTPVRHWVWLSIFSFVTTVCSPILPRIRLIRNMNPDLGQGFLMRPPPLTPSVSLLQSLQWEGRHGPPPHLHSTAQKVPLHVYSTSISQIPCFSENTEGL